MAATCVRIIGVQSGFSVKCEESIR